MDGTDAEVAAAWMPQPGRRGPGDRPVASGDVHGQVAV